MRIMVPDIFSIFSYYPVTLHVSRLSSMQTTNSAWVSLYMSTHGSRPWFFPQLWSRRLSSFMGSIFHHSDRRYVNSFSFYTFIYFFFLYLYFEFFFWKNNLIEAVGKQALILRPTTLVAGINTKWINLLIPELKTLMVDYWAPGCLYILYFENLYFLKFYLS